MKIKIIRKAKGVESGSFRGGINRQDEAAIFSECLIDAFDSLNDVQYNFDFQNCIKNVNASRDRYQRTLTRFLDKLL